jgi:hypothetical protein
MRDTGITLRELAAHLNCSASLLSYLLKAASAPAEDRELARSGEISTRELVRRVRSRRSRAISIDGEGLAFERECAAIEASRAIVDWLHEQKIAYPDQIKVVEQTRLRNLHADTNVLDSLQAYLPDIPLCEVIRIFRPVQELDGQHSPDWYAEWLGRWALHGIPDDGVRSRALENALSATRICFTSILVIDPPVSHRHCPGVDSGQTSPLLAKKWQETRDKRLQTAFEPRDRKRDQDEQ